jgi:hypothetical protein
MVACAVPDAETCDAIAQTLSLRSVKGVAVGPSKSYGRVLDQTFSALDSSLSGLEKRRNKAKTAKSQAAVIHSFGLAYHHANTKLKAASLNPVDAGLNGTLRDGFKSVAKACNRLAKAIRQDKRKEAIAAARNALKQAQAKLAKATDALDEVGYSGKPPSTPVKSITPRDLPTPVATSAPVVPTQAAPPVTSGGGTSSGGGSSSGGGGGGGVVVID